MTDIIAIDFNPRKSDYQIRKNTVGMPTLQPWISILGWRLFGLKNAVGMTNLVAVDFNPRDQMIRKFRKIP